MAIVPDQVREAIVRAVDERGLTYQATADLFGVGHATVNRELSRYRRTRTVKALPRGCGWASPIHGRIADLLTRIVSTMSDATVAELTEALQTRGKVQTTRSSVQRALHRLGFSRKKSRSWQLNETHPNGERFARSSARGSRR